MRTSTILFTSLYLLVGLASALEITPDFQGPNVGGICCSSGTTADPSGQCDHGGLKPFCCGGFFDSRKKSKGVKGGCDPFQDTFPQGRLVKTFPNSIQGCTINGQKGFIGCA
ncbi:hypothetical protein PspLS_11075 [Pyricularia sp. CBS 133598]|nr:hypothetical protein PspLS_11075 [Pyricularia sp. CBS 133598]